MKPERRAELVERATAFDLDQFCRDMEALREQYASWHSGMAKLCENLCLLGLYLCRERERRP